MVRIWKVTFHRSFHGDTSTQVIAATPITAARRAVEDMKGWKYTTLNYITNIELVAEVKGGKI